MRLPFPIRAFTLLLLAPVFARSGDLAPGSMQVHWDPGAKSCPVGDAQPIQVHRYNAQTIVLREKLCATWEAPFMYLLIGDKQALLIDTGDIADPKLMPVETMVMALLPGEAAAKMPLIVVHSHGHLDHRAGDPQFEGVNGVQLVRSDLKHVREYFGFADWPNGIAKIDLGDRIVDVLPAPGHHPAQLVYYDRNTGLVFSGDFLLPGRLLVDDRNAYETSAQRVAGFLRDRPVSFVLGGHVEKNQSGELLPWQSTYHPDEHALQLTKDDVEQLPAALRQFNGFYTESGPFVIDNPLRLLIALAAVAALTLALLGVLIFRFIRRRRKRIL
ncbi:MAG TPA: MBL fold metallo-hydrolase [Steroidobacteraceae bacterium]|jgi:glyoxylase-like metal-dependent hydrolase (beta-lactamase superfamily II)